MDYDHFLTCSSYGISKQRRFNLFRNLLHSLDTPHELTNLLIHGLQSFYNSQLTNTHASDHKAINHQRKIGWDSFSRGRISKQFIITMNEHYKQTQRTSTFTGIGWIKQIVSFVLSTHIDEWYHRCESNSNPNQISFQNSLMSLEKKSLLLTIEFFYSKAEILPVNLKIWFQSPLEEFKKYHVKRLKQWIANTKKLFKIHMKKNNYDSNKITDYFVRIGETTEKQFHKTSNLPLPNNNVPDYTVNNIIQKNALAPSQKQYITKNPSKIQFLSEQTLENNNMSTPDYLSYSTVTSSLNTNYTVIRTKNNNNKNFNNYFQSDSASHSETSKFNNMNRKIIPRRHTMAHYTINDTSASESTTYTSKNSNSSKNSDTSYIPSTDDNISYPVNKIQTSRRNKNNSKKIHTTKK